MKKVIILKGLPGSGKSTWARKTVDENPGQYKRVNKDDLRAMLDNSKWSRDNEKFVLLIRNQVILNALDDGKHVIVDDTNLNPKHENRIKELVKGTARVEVKFFDVPVEECIKRDLKRPNSVGSSVIKRMHKQLSETEKLEQDRSLPKAVIFDVDGTLAHMKDRGPFDWDKVGTDECDETVANLAKDYREAGYKIIVLTGRDGCCEDATRQWLFDNGIGYDLFFIRPAGDNRKDSVVKWEIFENHILSKYYVEVIFDDRDQVVSMWRSKGLKCFQVAEGNF